MARACASWPGVLLTVANFILIPMMIAATFIMRFSIGEVNNVGKVSQVEMYLTGFYVYSSSSFFVFNNCDYGANYFFTGNGCPSSPFPASYSASAGALACGILAFIAQITVWILFLVYTPVCCDGIKCGKGLIISIISMISVSLLLQIIELGSAFGIPGQVEAYYHYTSDIGPGFGLNLACIIIQIVILILICIYAKMGGRERCQCCSETRGTTTTTVVIGAAQVPPPTTTTVTTSEVIVQPQQPGYVVQQPMVQQPMMQQQVVFQPPTASYPPPDGYQYVNQPQPGFYPQQGPPPQQYMQPQQQAVPQYYQPTQ